MDTEDFMVKLEEAGEQLMATFTEVGDTMMKALDQITDIYTDEAEATEATDSSGKEGDKADGEATASDDGGDTNNDDDSNSEDDSSKDVNDAYDAEREYDELCKMSDELDDLIDSFNEKLDTTLDGAQNTIDKMLADDENESSDEPLSEECLIADTVSGAVDVLSTAVTDSLSLIDKFVGQSMDIVQRAQEAENAELSENDKEMMNKGRECIKAFNGLMQTVVKGGVDAVQGMVKSYSDAVKGKKGE